MLLLLADENFPIPSYSYLKDRGFDIKHITDSGLSSIEDEEVIQFSIDEKRIIITFDSDFGELIFKSGYRPIGVIYFRWKTFKPNDPGKFIEKVFTEDKIDFMSHLTVIDDQRIRQRKI